MILNYLDNFYLFCIIDTLHKKQLCSKQYFYSIYSGKKKLLYDLFIINRKFLKENKVNIMKNMANINILSPFWLA